MEGPSIEDCLKLLKGERDEQRLAGLLLATKFCKNDDFDSILRVYSALGNTFLDRLLRTGSYWFRPHTTSALNGSDCLFHEQMSEWFRHLPLNG
ncbi:putative neurochondrin [Helianthus annuus]|nr:putative neurochondrin [Helianthus annuus]